MPYVGFGMGVEEPINTPGEARKWVRDIAERGALGIKFFGASPEISVAALGEVRKLGLDSAVTYAQSICPPCNVLCYALR